MMPRPELNIEQMVMTMLVILLTMQMRFIVLHIMYMETMVRRLQLLLLLSSCFSGLLSTCKNQKGNKDGLIVFKTHDSDHDDDALLTPIAPTFLKRDACTHVLI